MKFVFIYIAIGVAIGGAAASVVFGRGVIISSFGKAASVVMRNEPARPYNADIAEDDSALFHDEDALYSYTKKFGPKKTTARLHALSAMYGSCHDAAHKGGRFSYELFEEESFKECGSECHSGCYHGATEAYFRDHGTDNLSKNLSTLCNNQLNKFFRISACMALATASWHGRVMIFRKRSRHAISLPRDRIHAGTEY